MRVLSKLNTAIAYDANKPGDHTVVIRPGVNVLSDADKAVLDVDPHFPKHKDLGHMVILPDEAPQAAPAPVAGEDGDDDKINEADPRARQPGESKNAHKARLKALDAAPPPPSLSPEDQSMVDSYVALTTDEAREGYKSMLDDRQRAVLAQVTKEGA